MIGFYLSGFSVGLCASVCLFVAVRVVSCIRDVADEI